MPEEVNRTILSKKGQRELSSFMGNGLMYDYICGVLDAERKKSVEEYLQNSAEAQSDFQKIQIGQQYAEMLKQITVSTAIRERLSVPSSYFSVLFRKSKFDQWPVGLKWGLEALVVIFVIVTFLTATPWEKLMRFRFATDSSGVILSEVNKARPAHQKENLSSLPEEVPQFVDESAIVKPSLSPTPKSKVETKVTTAPKTSQAAVAREEVTAESADSARASSGFLYRGQIAVTNLEAVGPKIKDKILELGGRKAGEVDLGWRKTPDSAYFHFTIPEAKYPELQAFLSEYGKAKIVKDTHPRVMPDGIIRLIITVDEAKK